MWGGKLAGKCQTFKFSKYWNSEIAAKIGPAWPTWCTAAHCAVTIELCVLHLLTLLFQGEPWRWLACPVGFDLLPLKFLALFCQFAIPHSANILPRVP
jgi:hypothetical protein